MATQSESISGSLPPSSSVQAVLENFHPGERVTSWALVKALFARHPEYGSGVADKLANEPGPVGGEQLPASEWIEQVSLLYDHTRVSLVDGRLLAYGLTQIDQGLRRYLENYGFLEALASEIQREHEVDNVNELLAGTPLPVIGPADPPILHADSPTVDDQLGRAGFAEGLAGVLSSLWQETNSQSGKPGNQHNYSEGQSFVLHLHGPWGIGKTSLLRMLERSLQEGASDRIAVNSSRQNARHPSPDHQDQREETDLTTMGQWIVVWFNAWQQQRINMSWWSLMDTVYRESLAQMKKRRDLLQALRLSLKEKFWRLSNGPNWVNYAALGLSAITLAAALWGLFHFGVFEVIGAGSEMEGEAGLQGDQTASGINRFSEWISAISALLSLVGTIWSGSRILGRSLIRGSAESARTFEQTSGDPMPNVRRHFQKMVLNVGRPIIVFIDDLDRCRPDYVVGLMEGIQTLFSHPQVCYVIAGDRRWIYQCFESEYKDMTDAVREPGRRMGSLFLEKAVQLSVPVPQMSESARKTYTDYLLKVGGTNGLAHDLNVEREKARQKYDEATRGLNGIALEEAILNVARDARVHATENPLLFEAHMAEAARQIGVKSRDLQQSTTVFLQDFRHLLEPTPRALKRLVNAYGVNFQLALQGNHELRLDDDPQRKKRSQLALWTILNLRWPELGDYLMHHPEKIKAFCDGTAATDDDIEEGLRILASDRQVRDVVQGTGVTASLDLGAINNILGHSPSSA